VSNQELDAPIDSRGNTCLHIAVHNGYAEIVHLLLRSGASREILNDQGQTAEREAKANDTIQALFKASIRPPSSVQTNSAPGSHFVAATPDIELWLDTYEYAHRISAQNREYLKRWLIKIPYTKLINELEHGYINQLINMPATFSDNLKQYMHLARIQQSPLPLIFAYTEEQCFSHRLNTDLALLGSDFRFQSSHAKQQSRENISSHRDNEAPKGAGQYIYAAIIMNHPLLEQYYYTGRTFRGMNITKNDLDSYTVGNIILTRSFLSTSKKRDVAEIFLNFNDPIADSCVLCIYNVKNLSSGLGIESISKFKNEEEVIIVPYTAFRIIGVQEHVSAMFHTDQYLCEIELEECEQQPEWLI
jgi:hypothetical protein